MLDKWRSGVFTGEITEENLNSSRWELREKYQGITSPMERGEEYFDPAPNTIYQAIRHIQDIILQK